MIHKRQEIDKTENMLSNLPDPYKFIQCTNKSKILGHMMASDNSTTHAVTDRLNKANGDWGTIRDSCLTNINYKLNIDSLFPML